MYLTGVFFSSSANVYIRLFRKNLLSFALTYCPVHHIEDILNEKTLLETQVLNVVDGNVF